MNWDLWRSHGRIFAHWTCLYFSLCLWVANLCFCPAFVSQNIITSVNTTEGQAGSLGFNGTFSTNRLYHATKKD